MFGYPLVCPPNRNYAENPSLDPLLRILKEHRPEIVAVQLDPMEYMYQARKFALANLPTYKKGVNQEIKGIFANHNEGEEEKDMSMNYTERIH